jgi:hypothetical protein
MSHRTQITLTDAQYALLKRESKRTGVGLAELVRRAVDSRYARPAADVEDGLEASFGIWKDRDFDSVEYVERLRGPGLGHRLLRDDRR